MKVGTDGVLLGAWVGVTGAERAILDIGTGTGVIALMLAQRTCNAQITAIDIDTESVRQASGNFRDSPWKERLHGVQMPIQQYDPENRFDWIVTNPPYFTESLHSPDAGRNRVRHTVDLSFEELVDAVLRLLDPAGRFALILPVAEMSRFRSVALGRLFPTRITHVRTAENKPVKRVLAEFSAVPQPLREESRLVIGSEEYRRLTGEFYLDF